MKFCILGDLAFTGLLSEQPEKNLDRFKYISPILSNSDYVFANLEVPIKVDNDINEYKNLIHYSLLEPTQSLLKLLNISCVSLANNHIYDCKMSGLKATIKLLDTLGIFHTGAGWKPEHIKPVLINKDNKRIAFLAYVDKETNPKSECFTELLINYYELNNVINDINNIKQEADVIICSIHWGEDYSLYPNNRQIQEARVLIERGVNIVMGHHSHTFQPFEYYKNGIIFYSLGGVTFGDFRKKNGGEYEALYRITKKTAIVSYNINTKDTQFFAIKELKGNYINKDKRNYFRWNKKQWYLIKIKNKYKIVNKYILFKEEVLNRIIEYFFGYYKNPIVRLFQFRNISKVKNLLKKLNERKTTF